ncbi:MAG: HD domain-containing protein [Eubacteriales bacterium]
MDQKYGEIKKIVRDELSYAAHDLDHVLRVYRLCKTIGSKEENVDCEVLEVSALLHDIARGKEDNDLTGKIDHAVLGAEMAQNILESLNYRKITIEKVKHCIISHRFRSAYKPCSLEAKILFDADKLDVLGAVGVARSFMLAGEHGERIFFEGSLADYIEDNIGENGRIIDVSKHSSNIEYEMKLKKIPERLYTSVAKEIAQSRMAFMDQYFKNMEAEIKGER